MDNHTMDQQPQEANNTKAKEPVETTKRVVVYVSEEQHRQLRSKLALEGGSVSSWVRDQIEKFLEN